MPTDISKEALNKETDALFWAQTGYKVGQKLNPNNEMDKAYLPVWMDISRKVQRAADAGTLVTTYDHPVVVQHLTDATVASKAAAAHLDAAVAASDPATTQANIHAATTATQISTQKAREAAANQPPMVSPVLVKEAGKEAIKAPPPPSAPSGDHIAHGLAHAHAHGHHTPVQEQPLPAAPPTGPEALYKETNVRFWRQTGYKPGQKLDQTSPQDREMAKRWMVIFRQVQHEAATGTLLYSSQEPLFYPSPTAMPTPPWIVRPPTGPRPMMPPYQPYPQMPPYQPYQQALPYQPYPQMSQMLQQPPSPNGHERGRHKHHQGHGHGQHPSMGPQPGGQPPPMDASTPQSGPGPGPGMPPSSPPSSSPPSEGAPPADMPGASPSPDTSPTPPEASSLGTYLAIGLAIVAGGGLLYYATSSRKSPGRSPKVLLATPTRTTSMSALTRP